MSYAIFQNSYKRTIRLSHNDIITFNTEKYIAASTTDTLPSKSPWNHLIRIITNIIDSVYYHFPIYGISCTAPKILNMLTKLFAKLSRVNTEFCVCSYSSIPT